MYACEKHIVVKRAHVLRGIPQVGGPYLAAHKAGPESKGMLTGVCRHCGLAIVRQSAKRGVRWSAPEAQAAAVRASGITG